MVVDEQTEKRQFQVLRSQLEQILPRTMAHHFLGYFLQPHHIFAQLSLNVIVHRRVQSLWRAADKTEFVAQSFVSVCRSFIPSFPSAKRSASNDLRRLPTIYVQSSTRTPFKRRSTAFISTARTIPSAAISSRWARPVRHWFLREKFSGEPSWPVPWRYASRTTTQRSVSQPARHSGHAQTPRSRPHPRNRNARSLGLR